MGFCTQDCKLSTLCWQSDILRLTIRVLHYGFTGCGVVDNIQHVVLTFWHTPLQWGMNNDVFSRHVVFLHHCTSPFIPWDYEQECRDLGCWVVDDASPCWQKTARSVERAWGPHNPDNPQPRNIWPLPHNPSHRHHPYNPTSRQCVVNLTTRSDCTIYAGSMYYVGWSGCRDYRS